MPGEIEFAKPTRVEYIDGELVYEEDLKPTHPMNSKKKLELIRQIGYKLAIINGNFVYGDTVDSLKALCTDYLVSE